MVKDHQDQDIVPMLVEAFAAFSRSADKLNTAYKQLVSNPNSKVRKDYTPLYLPFPVSPHLLIGALECIVNGVIVTDEDSRIIIFNTMAQDLTGLKATDILGKLYQDVFDGEHLLEALKTPTSRYYQKHLTGGVEIEAYVATVIDNNRSIIGAVEILMNQKAGALIGGYKQEGEVPVYVPKLISVISDIIMNIAHRMRSPLSAIQLFAELLKQDLDDNKQKIVDDILVGVHSLDAVLSNLLSFAQPVNPHLRKVDFIAILDESLLFASSAIKQQDILLVKEYSSDELYCYGDLEQLKQVCFNLILNAIQAMPEGGKLRVSVGYSDDMKHINVIIEDNGCGIPDESMDKIFTPFFTTKEGGTGLGLYVVYRIIQAHRGTIQINSTYGYGTVVSIQLPIEGS